MSVVSRMWFGQGWGFSTPRPPEDICNRAKGGPL